MTEDMFGGLHRNDEMKRAEQSGWSRKKTKSADRNKGLAAEALLRSLDGCHWVSRNSPQSALDTADFVRHVPMFPGLGKQGNKPLGPRVRASLNYRRRRPPLSKREIRVLCFKNQPLGLQVQQARQLPSFSATASVSPFGTTSFRN